jgi:DNA modification methylase
VLKKGELLAYLVAMTLRIAEIHRVLKPTGSFYLHCDPNANHYLKIILDSIFCGNKGLYLSELVWRRTTAHGNAKQGAKKFEINFDTIFLYSKSNKYTFNTVYEPFKEEQIKQQYNKIDDQGRRYRLVTPTAAKGGGDTSYEFHGVKPPKGRFWAYSKENMETFYQENKLYFSSSGQPYIKYYLDERPGVAVMAFWDDIKPMSPTSKERLGYPTQKPEALLERIIKASSNENDVILDAFLGGGNSISVAQRLNRNWIGIDITYQSIGVILKRLEDSFGAEVLQTIQLNGIPKDVESAKLLAEKKDDRTRKEFEKWAVLTYSNNRAIINDKKGKDQGIDGIAYFQGEKTQEKIILQVKSGKVGAKDIRDLQGVLTLENAALGIFITLQKPTKDMIKTAKSAGIYQNKYMSQPLDKIQLITIEEMLEEQKRLNLKMTFEVLKSAEKQQQIKADQMKLEL